MSAALKPDAPDVWSDAATVLALRTVAADGTSRDGKFRYDLTPGAVVTAPDWSPKPVCGGGLHVLVEGHGDWSLLDYASRLAASGDASLILGAYGAVAKAGKNGCIAIAWRTPTGKPRVSVGYVGDELKADTWYRLNARGEFEEVKS